MTGSPARGEPLDLAPTPLARSVAEAVAAAGGRALMVGGWPRDRLLGRPSRDLDLEVFGLTPERLAERLARFGAKGPVGRQRPVWRLPRAELDVGHPGAAALAYHPDRPESLAGAFRMAARQRDLTINAIGWDPLDCRLFDPFHGRRDLEARRLRAVDRDTFADDPLRLLRVARFCADLEAEPDQELMAICRDLAFEGVAPERIAGELRRLLAGSREPSRGLVFLERAGRLNVLAPIAALRGVPQDPVWHPEGDVLVHTRSVVDRAAEQAMSLPCRDAEILLWAALCHDVGKPSTTTIEEDRIRSRRHDVVGAEITRDWLEELRLPGRTVRAVVALVRHHLAPSQLVSGGAGPRAYRRLARRLAEAGVTLIDLERLARADHLGRTTEAARQGVYEAGDRFLEIALAAGVDSGPRPDVVRAPRLMSRGLPPGPALGRALTRCRELEDEREAPDPDQIVEMVLHEDGDR